MDKISCLIEEEQRKEKVESMLSSDHVETQSSPYKQVEIKLPKITVPIFNWDPSSWEGFWKSFSASVDCKDLPPT